MPISPIPSEGARIPPADRQCFDDQSKEKSNPVTLCRCLYKNKPGDLSRCCEATGIRGCIPVTETPVPTPLMF
jgi:hypothetical protein